MAPWGRVVTEQLGSSEEHLRWPSLSGNPLKRLRTVVDFDAWRTELEAALPRADRSGRSPWDAALQCSTSWSCRRSTRYPTSRPVLRIVRTRAMLTLR